MLAIYNDFVSNSSNDTLPGKGDHKKKVSYSNTFLLTKPQLAKSQSFDVLLERFLSPEPPNPAQSTEKDQNSSSASELCYLDFFGDNTAMQRLLQVEGLCKIVILTITPLSPCKEYNMWSN